MLYITDTYRISEKFRRNENQDRCFVISTEASPSSEYKMSIQCVLDGVSSSNGAKASQLAAKALIAPLSELIGGIDALVQMNEQDRMSTIYNILKNAVRTADDTLRVKYGNAASTVSIAVVFMDTVYTCNVGDSPIILAKLNFATGQPKLTELYQCHNQAGIDLARGNISKEEALISSDKNLLLRCIGGSRPIDDMKIFVTHTYLSQDNILLLGSDGALSVLGDDMLSELICKNRGSMKSLCHSLYDAVYSTDATDNFTIMATRLELG